MTPRGLFFGMLVARGSGARLIAHLHERPVPSQDLRWGLLRWLGNRADAVIAVSEFIRDRVVAGGVQAGKVSAVLNTVDVRRFHPGVDGSGIRRDYGIPPDDVLVVCLGRFLTGKGQLFLARAMRHVAASAPQARALMIGWDDRRYTVGNRSYREQVAAYVAEQGLGGVVMLGEPRPEAPEIMAAADIVAQPAIGDPCPLTVLEAMASGKPIVAFRSGGIPEEVGSDGRALLVEPGDEMALAEAIGWLARHPESRRAMGRANRERAVRQFYPERLAEEVSAVYERLLNAPA